MVDPVRSFDHNIRPLHVIICGITGNSKNSRVHSLQNSQLSASKL